MVKGDDEIAALLAEMEQKQYGSVSEPAPQELDEVSTDARCRCSDALLMHAVVFFSHRLHRWGTCRPQTRRLC